jgi:high-affinity iron transporter
MFSDLLASSVGPLVIVFREALEAGLITSVIFGYLKGIGRRDLFRWGYLGVCLSLASSFLLGYSLFFFYASLAEEVATILQGLAGMTAVVVLSYMILWMAKNSRKIKGELEARIEVAVSTGNLMAISLIAFTTVGREGLETVLFLSPFARNDPLSVAVGSVAGATLALSLLYLLALRIAKARLSSVFKYTSLLVAMLAAGIMFHTTAELTEALDGAGFPLGFLSSSAYDLGIPATSPFSEEGILGGVIHSFTGFMNSAPWLSVVCYVIYWSLMGAFLYRTYK